MGRLMTLSQFMSEMVEKNEANNSIVKSLPGFIGTTNAKIFLCSSNNF